MSQSADSEPGTALILGASAIEEVLPVLLPGWRIKRYRVSLGRWKLLVRIVARLRFGTRTRLYVYGFNQPSFLDAFSRRFDFDIGRIEDGFLRSVQLGRMGAAPLSLCLDSRGIYFDPTHPSDLEHIYNTYDFEADTELAARARAGIDALLSSRLSKYNTARSSDIDRVLGPRTGRRILVVGQVEGDMSIVKGCTPPRLNLDLVKLARAENPDARVFYKPHPEVIYGTRDGQSDPKLAEPYCTVLYDDIPLADVLEAVDHVYTITSLAGFEALLRGLPVTCLGAPFYAGWGLTDDRQKVDRRKRTLTIEQLFAGAYLLYPIYVHPERKARITYEEALALLADMKARHDRDKASETGAHAFDEALHNSAVFRDGGDGACTYPVPVFGVTLDRQPQRWLRLARQARALKLAVRRVTAVDRLTTDRAEIEAAFGSAGDNLWAPASLAAMCQALSHQRAWQAIRESGAEVGIVLEDGVTLCPAFAAYLSDDLPAMMRAHGLDVLRLDHNAGMQVKRWRPYAARLSEVPFQPGATLYRLHSGTVGAGAYAITAAALDRIAAAHPRLKVPVDHFLFSQAARAGFRMLKIGQVSPAPVVNYLRDPESDLFIGRLPRDQVPVPTDFERWRNRKSEHLYRALVRARGTRLARLEVQPATR